MTIPSFGWAGLTDAEISQKSPVPILALRNAGENIREMILDPDTMTPAVAHDHDTANSGLIWWPSHNLIITASLNTNTLSGSNSEWEVKSGITSKRYDEDGGVFMNMEGEFVYTNLGGGDNSSIDDLTSERAFGRGAPVVVSVYAKVKSTVNPPVNEGEIAFGIASGSTTDFLPGCKAFIDWTDLATTHKRFWFTCTFGDVTDPVGMLIKCTAPFDHPAVLDCAMVTLGTSLSYWMPMPNDAVHKNLLKVSTYVPIWDEAKSITGAIRLPAY